MSDHDRPHDLTRGMRLLWRAERASTRGPRQSLDLDHVVAAAIAVADADGLDGLSMRKVADRLGVGTMSLYTYVPAKAELVSLMLDATDAEGVLPHTVDGSWRTRTVAWAREDWATYHRHPWTLYASSRHPLGPNSLRRFDSALRALGDTGLADAELVATVDVIDNYTRGMARRSVEERQLAEHTGVSSNEWWAEHGPMLDEHVTAEAYPAVRRVWESGAFSSTIDSFELGLERIVAGIASRVGAPERVSPA